MKVEIYLKNKTSPFLETTENALNLHIGDWLTVSKNNKVKGGVIKKMIHLIDSDRLYVIRVFLGDEQ